MNGIAITTFGIAEKLALIVDIGLERFVLNDPSPQIGQLTSQLVPLPAEELDRRLFCTQLLVGGGDGSSDLILKS